MRVHDARLQQLEGCGQAVGARPAKQSPRGVEADNVEGTAHHHGQRSHRPAQARIGQHHQQKCSGQRIADRERDDDRLNAVCHRVILTPVFGSMSAPLARTFRNVSSSDFGRRCTSITLPSASIQNRSAVFSSPVWSTVTLSSKITCAVGLSFCTFTIASTGCPVVAWKCETLTVYSPETMPRTVTISSRMGEGIFRPLTRMKSLAPPRSSR